MYVYIFVFKVLGDCKSECFKETKKHDLTSVLNVMYTQFNIVYTIRENLKIQ